MFRRFGWAMVPACLLVSGCGGGSAGSPSGGVGASTPAPVVSAALAAPAAAAETAPPSATSAPSSTGVEAIPGDVHFSWTEDASRDYFNSALELPWPVDMGTWRDRNGTAQGTLPFASLAFVDKSEEQVVRWDVTDLVRQHGADFLIKRSGGTSVRFHSREAADPARRPRLIVSRGSGLKTYTPVADTSLNASTYKPQGDHPHLTTIGPILIRFDVAADPGVSRVELELTATTEQFGNQTLDVFRADARPRPIEALAVEAGTANDVIFELSGNDWQAKTKKFRNDRMAVNGDGSLTVRIPAGDDTGSDSIYSIPPSDRREVMFARAIMKIHADWTATMGGKFPGLANTGLGDRRAEQCAWGGRLANGVCWSARTNRKGYVANTPFADTNQALSPYVYRVNYQSVNGDGPASSKTAPKGRYFVLDQMVKLNTIGADGTPQANGEIAYWLNGELINRMTGIIWRKQAGPDTLPSEYWLDVYEGGTGYAAPHDHTVSFKKVILSTKLLPYDASEIERLNAGQ